jgi:hypothetical protein
MSPMTDAIFGALNSLPLDTMAALIRWMVLGVGIVFVYYVVYSLRRLRRTQHYIANRLTVVLGEHELQLRDRDANAAKPTHRYSAARR